MKNPLLPVELDQRAQMSLGTFLIRSKTVLCVFAGNSDLIVNIRKHG